MNVKQFKRRFINGLVEPELFYVPVKNKVEPEPMIIKILVTDTDNKFSIDLRWGYIRCPYYFFNYLDMEEEYKNNGKIQLDPLSGYIDILPYYNFDVNNSKNYFVTDDIDYFREPNDCLYKEPNDHYDKIIYSKCCSTESAWCEIDWGDGTIENCNDYISEMAKIFEDYLKSHSNYRGALSGIKEHVYEETGEYFVKIKGIIPHIAFTSTLRNNNCNIVLEDVVQWGNMNLYDLTSLFDCGNNANKIKMPEHISSNSFKNVLSASRAFYGCTNNETEYSQEIIYDFVNTFPNLLDCFYMFERTGITYIPKHFCYNHKNIINCFGMFSDTPITYIGERAFANCDNLSSVSHLVWNGGSPLLTRIDDGIFENDINLLKESSALNFIDSNYNLKSLYIDENLGLKTVGNNIYKNCKRLRRAFELFYNQAGLVSVGESLFEGCEDLIDVNMCFYKCLSLERIGDNIFKGCTKVRRCSTFCYEDYLVNFPDKMFYDLKYYDYLKGMTDYGGFNGYWNYVREQNGVIVDRNSYLNLFFKYKNYNHNNFPTRKHSKDLFSKEYISDCIAHGDVNWNYENNGIFNSFIQFSNTISDEYSEEYIISNFTGDAFPLWEHPELLSYNSKTFGIRKIKRKDITYAVNGRKYHETYKVCMNYYDNYGDIAAADPLPYFVGIGEYRSRDILLNTYFYPDEYENELGKQEVIEFNDPIEYVYEE